MQMRQLFIQVTIYETNTIKGQSTEQKAIKGRKMNRVKQLKQEHDKNTRKKKHLSYLYLERETGNSFEPHQQTTTIKTGY